jgi:hypothetical protein
LKRQQWEGEVERGGFGLRVGGDDLDLNELLPSGSHVLVTIVWPDQDSDGDPLYRIMAPATGTLPPRPGTTSEDDGEEPAA